MEASIKLCQECHDAEVKHVNPPMTIEHILDLFEKYKINTNKILNRPKPMPKEEKKEDVIDEAKPEDKKEGGSKDSDDVEMKEEPPAAVPENDLD
jgi:hypothetical protein